LIYNTEWIVSQAVNNHYIDDFMSTNRLKLNPDKAQLTWFGPKQQLAQTNVKEVQVQNTQLSISRCTTNLSVHFDCNITLLTNIQNICKEWYCQLRQLLSVRKALHTDVTKSLMQSISAIASTTATAY